MDVDEAELAENLELGADLSSENLTVTVVPKKSDEFTHVMFSGASPQSTRSRGQGRTICKDCA